MTSPNDASRQGALTELQRLGQEFDRGQMAGVNSRAFSCNCIGPQNGDPVCPCMMPAHREREMHKRSHELLMKLLAERDASPFPVATALCAVCRKSVCNHSDLEFAGVVPGEGR